MQDSRWYKGCLHAHSTDSDGDASPEQVADWYRRLGYDWLVLSEHNVLTSPIARAPEGLLMISGEELTARLDDDPTAVYVNAVGISRVVEPVAGDDVLQTVQANVDAVVQAGGIASLTAPYLRPGFDHHSLVQVSGATLMDIYNAHPNNVLGDPRTFSYEELWDALVTAGKIIYGVATDDAHNYHEFGADNANPGRAWVMVRCGQPTEESVLRALRAGDFYSSTGITLETLESGPDGISLTVSPKEPQAYRTTFVGRGGAVLSEVDGTSASYRARGDEGYVRARVTSTWGARAWVQPAFVG